MMAEYIDRDSIYATLADEHPFGWTNDDLAELFRQAKTADVAPVKHGRWERVVPSKNAAKWSSKVSCSICHREGYTRYNYWPNCGAKMLEEDEK